jgi:hypothetical protein
MIVGIALTFAFLAPISALVEHRKYQPSTKSFRLM